MSNPTLELPRADKRRIDSLMVAFVVVSTPIFALFAYNSGYGTDQTGYLVIGRNIANGGPFFEIIHSKSFGVYGVVALLLKAGIPLQHFSLSIVISVFYAIQSSATYWVFSRRFDPRVALATAILVGCSIAFMEQNFLQEDGFVYLSGLAAFHFTCRALEDRPWRNMFLAGLSIAIGFHFKNIVGFYAVGIGLFACISLWRRGFVSYVIGTWGVAITLGFLVGALPPILYFAATDRFADFWEWTINFPLFHYPAHNTYRMKFFTKLAWFHALLLGGFALSFQRDIRQETYGYAPVRLALLMAVVSCIPVLRVQASQYIYPSAGFLLVFVCHVVSRCLEPGRPLRIQPRSAAIAAVALGALFLVSTMLYKPAAMLRFVQLNDYASEDLITEFIQSQVAPDEKILILTKNNSPVIYWLADRKPAIKSIAVSVQTTYLFRNNPEILLDSLDDPEMVLVDYDPEFRNWEDFFFEDYPENVELMGEFHRRLAERFERVQDPHHPSWWWWKRKSADALDG